MRSLFEICQPREDVRRGLARDADFAADLSKVIRGDAPAEYRDAATFFANTHPTTGLRAVLKNVGLRLSGRGGEAASVFRLDTQYGGGKTHAMLALWQVAAVRPLGDFPQDTQELLLASGYTGTPVNRVALVGNHLSPSGITKPDGTTVNTLWGELAWQLGGAGAYAQV